MRPLWNPHFRNASILAMPSASAAVPDVPLARVGAPCALSDARSEAKKKHHKIKATQKAPNTETQSTRLPSSALKKEIQAFDPSHPQHTGNHPNITENHPH